MKGIPMFSKSPILLGVGLRVESHSCDLTEIHSLNLGLRMNSELLN